MRINHKPFPAPLAMIASVGGLASIASADIPQMGGPMSHLLVSIFNDQVFLEFESPSMSTVELQSSPSSFGGSASVLDGMGFNSQFGWLAEGFISLPPSSGVFVRALSMSQHLEVYSEFGYDPIMGTDGSDQTWQWDGTMTHNWFATEVKGPHAASFEVFVGDLSGNPLDGWTSGTIDLNFIYGGDPNDRLGVRGAGMVGQVPSPGSLLVLGSGFCMVRRRR